MTSGSTGLPAVFAFDTDEWVAHLARSAQSRALAGAPQAPAGRERPRSARVGSSSPNHMSAQVAGTLRDPRRPSLALDAVRPVPELARRLDEWQPHTLSGFPSVLQRLAQEQLAGRLRIAPARVFPSGEVLTAGARRSIREAWGSEPFDQYVTTEAGIMAGECSEHAGLHLNDDVVLEAVDDSGRSVPDGEEGARVLLTVLTSRTVPLIRYEVTDRVRFASDPCPCGRPGRVVEHVTGRTREVLRLPGRQGTDVDVHPTLFSRVLDAVPSGGWQVVAQPHRLLVRLAVPGDGVDPTDVVDAVARALAGLGVDRYPVAVEVVASLPSGADGKRPLVTTDPER
jgi:phenylacetate-coenzyme A ligase PaaK-like adenylate-forming protein